MMPYDSAAYEFRSCDLALHFYRRARMNGHVERAKRTALAWALDRLYAAFKRRPLEPTAWREPAATLCERCGAPLDELEVARAARVQMGRWCRRCEAGR